MTYILLYIPPPFKVSGGLGNFKLFFDICKKLNYHIYYCPLLKNIPSLDFITPFNDRRLETISREELISYYVNSTIPAEYISPNDIITPEILTARNNIVIYPEDVIGNPAEQKYIVRWLFFFPIPSAVCKYNFETDYICFYSDYIFNFYKHLCIACGISDYLTKKITKINICRVFKFEPETYSLISQNRVINENMNTNRKCFTLRKLFPPRSFDEYNKGVNLDYAREIIQIKKNKINILNEKIKKTSNFLQKSEYEKELVNLINLKPNLSSNDVIREFLTDKFKSLGYDLIEGQPSSSIYIDYFQGKDFFLSFDPFTFMSIIASLCGCISVVKKINGLSFDEWINGDPFNKYGIAYGQEGIGHALKTQHLLLNHITDMYSQNENNVLNLMDNLETHFNIKIFRSWSFLGLKTFYNRIFLKLNVIIHILYCECLKILFINTKYYQNF